MKGCDQELTGKHNFIKTDDHPVQWCTQCGQDKRQLSTWSRVNEILGTYTCRINNCNHTARNLQQLKKHKETNHAY